MTGSTARVIRVDTMGRGQVLREVDDVDKAVEIIESAGVTTDCS